MFPDLFNQKKKQKDTFIQERLYIEKPMPTKDPELENKKEETERGVTIIDLT